MDAMLGRVRGWLILAMALAALPALAGGYRTRQVVIVVMDGARYSETWGDPARANIPRIAAELAPVGVVLTDFRTRITGIAGGASSTNPGHATLVTGAYQLLANDGTQLPGLPTIFQLYRKQFAAPDAAAWVVASKDKLAICTDSAAPGWNGQYRPRFDCGVNGDGTGGYRSDDLTHKAACAALLRDRPALMLVNYKEPDSKGHAGDWQGYLDAIRAVDGYVADLWKLIQTDPQLRDTTTLFVTNDHGRHDDAHGGFDAHGDACEGCTHLLLVAAGPDFRKGAVSDAPREHPDVAVTAAALLGIRMPDAATGAFMDELLAPALPGLRQPDEAPRKRRQHRR